VGDKPERGSAFYGFSEILLSGLNLFPPFSEGLHEIVFTSNPLLSPLLKRDEDEFDGPFFSLKMGRI
jgi:hypothetical protein